MVLVDNDADEVGPYSDFEVMSVVCPAAKVTGEIALKLLQVAGEKKYGGFIIRGEVAIPASGKSAEKCHGARGWLRGIILFISYPDA